MFRIISILALVACLSLSGCATAIIGGAVIGTAATATKYAVKGTVGAGKLAYRGTKAAIKGTAHLLSDAEKQPAAPALADDYRQLPDPE